MGRYCRNYGLGQPHGSSVGGTGLEAVMETFRRYSLAEEACHWVRVWSVAPPLPVPSLSFTSVVEDVIC